jgi:hypothetical protein
MSRLAFTVVLSSAAAMAAAGDLPCPGTGDCHEPHGGLGCIMTECCEIVCEINPLCCDLGWDEACVELAATECQGIACPSAGACDAPHANPGCADESCCNLVCDLDPWCCSFSWDAACVNAAELCVEKACTIAIPAGATPEGEPCYRRVNDGCNMPEDAVFAPLACGQVISGKWSTGSPRDTDWYALTLETAGQRRVRLQSEFPSETMVASGDCDGPFIIHRVDHGGPCDETVFELDLPAGTWFLVVSGGTEARPFRRDFPCDEVNPDAPPPGPDDPPYEPGPFGLRYVLTLECTVTADLNGDGVVGPADLAILLGGWGQPGATDLDGDGTTGAADLTVLLGAWTT